MYGLLLLLSDPSFFESRGINSQEFSCMAKMSSWAVDNVAMSDHNAEPRSDAEGKNEKKTTRMGANGTTPDISDHREDSDLAAPNVSHGTHTSISCGPVPVVDHYGYHRYY